MSETDIYNNILNQQKTNQFANELETTLAENKDKRRKELEGILFNNSPILRNSPRPLTIYDERGNSAKKSLFCFFSPLDTNKQLNKKFVYLTEKKFPIISSDVPGFDYEGIEFRGIISKDEKVREKVENIVVKGFAQTLERNYLTAKLCWKKYQPESIKDFKELKIDEPQHFFDNLFEHIDSCGSAKDILIIADRKTYRFIKQLENYVGNILEADLENNIKLIIVSQKGLLIPCWVDRYYSNWKDNTYRLEFHYNIDLMDNNPIVIFKEKEKKNQ